MFTMLDCLIAHLEKTKILDRFSKGILLTQNIFLSDWNKSYAFRKIHNVKRDSTRQYEDERESEVFSL